MSDVSEDAVDVRIVNHLSTVAFEPLTDAAREWIEEHVVEPMWFGGAVMVEPRYADGLAEGMHNDGLVLE